jgi:integrase
MGTSKKLSAKRVESVTEPGRYGDGDGLWLQVTKIGDNTTKAWIYRFMLDRRARHMGLGAFPLFGLADARKRRDDAAKLIADGIDPIEHRNAQKAAIAAENAKALTFKECGEDYIEAHKSGWKSAKHEEQWRATLETYVYPVIGRLQVGDVEQSHILKILKPMWNTKTETASRVRGRIEKVLDRAKALKLRKGENPARWIGNLDQLLPAKSQVNPVRHHPALPYRDLPSFMEKLRARHGFSAKALEFTILTVARTNDTIGAKRSEIDGQEKLWTIPAARIKGKKGHRRRDHVVPLSDAALSILKDLPTDVDYVFPGESEGGGLSNMAMAEMLKAMGYSGDVATVHGFRSTFKDWCSEQTAYPNELSEMAMAHTVSDKVEAAYRRGDMREKRRRLMDDWAEFCASKPADANNVVPIRSAAQ